jgi:hypothetical protein
LRLLSATVLEEMPPDCTVNRQKIINLLENWQILTIPIIFLCISINIVKCVLTWPNRNSLENLLDIDYHYT